RLRHEPPEQGVQIGREVMNCSLDQGGQRRQTYEELTQVVEAELLGIVERVDPPPVNDLTFSKQEACQIEAEDANRVKPALAGPTLVKVAEARNQPGQKSGPIGMSQGNHRLAHERETLARITRDERRTVSRDASTNPGRESTPSLVPPRAVSFSESCRNREGEACDSKRLPSHPTPPRDRWVRSSSHKRTR